MSRRSYLALAMFAALPSLLAAQAPATAVAATAADARLKSLYDAYADWDSAQSASFVDSRGELQPAGQLPHVDEASQQRRESFLRGHLAALDTIPVAQLSPAEKVNAAVLRTVIENSLSDLHFRLWEMPFNSDSSFWIGLDSDQPLDDAAAYRRYIGRMRDVPRLFDDEIVNMRSGLARGFTVPRATLTGRDKSITAFATPGASNPFLKAFATMPSSIPVAEQQALRADASAAVAEAVAPAYRKLLQFYRSEYYPKARATIGAQDLPDGDAFYRAQVKEYTTLDLTPEEIHQIGLKQVAIIDAAMRQTMRDSGFKGSLAAFLHFLKTDPRFVAKTPDELLGVSSYVAKRVDGKLGDEFGLLPRRRFAILPVPDAIAPFYTSGRGGADSCLMNTYNLPTRPLYNIPALTLHECAPGHALQGALSAEEQALPRFRRNLYFSGYGEGWGLYSEWLGNEMGIYRNPYEKFGQLSYAMWRAARLVIDTGIHRYGWSRSKAIAYLASHTALSSHEVETEVDRYISWPGQALSYKLGELTIRELRSEAEATLGPRFDKRGFHDTILAMGAVPLNVLKDQMHAWIAAQAAKPAPAAQAN